jgi:tetraacyldisaccharide 4'-kinase
VRTPAFWSDNSTLSQVLHPISKLYEFINRLRYSFIRPAKFPIPVLCIGNITAGGSGKTPVALHIGRLLKERNAGAFFLSRGYGGTLKGPVMVDPKKHSAREVGDEPLLLAQVLPTIISKNRVQGARLALQKGAKLIVMDDGFQNPSIAKTCSILVLDGKIGLGNGRIIPAGPLREAPENAFKRAHAVIILNRSTAIPPIPAGIMVLQGKTRLQNAANLKGKKIFAFCGLAYPHKFYDALHAAGANMAGTSSFADHHLYSDIDMNKLLAQSITQDAALITTHKDAVRVPEKFRDCIATVDMNIDFDDERMLELLIKHLLDPHANA